MLFIDIPLIPVHRSEKNISRAQAYFHDAHEVEAAFDLALVERIEAEAPFKTDGGMQAMLWKTTMEGRDCLIFDFGRGKSMELTQTSPDGTSSLRVLAIALPKGSLLQRTEPPGNIPTSFVEVFPNQTFSALEESDYHSLLSEAKLEICSDSAANDRKRAINLRRASEGSDRVPGVSFQSCVELMGPFLESKGLTGVSIKGDERVTTKSGQQTMTWNLKYVDEGQTVYGLIIEHDKALFSMGPEERGRSVASQGSRRKGRNRTFSKKVLVDQPAKTYYHVSQEGGSVEEIDRATFDGVLSFRIGARSCSQQLSDSRIAGISEQTQEGTTQPRGTNTLGSS